MIVKRTRVLQPSPAWNRLGDNRKNRKCRMFVGTARLFTHAAYGRCSEHCRLPAFEPDAEKKGREEHPNKSGIGKSVIGRHRASELARWSRAPARREYPSPWLEAIDLGFPREDGFAIVTAGLHMAALRHFEPMTSGGSVRPVRHEVFGSR